jgi:hypothetical protein
MGGLSGLAVQVVGSLLRVSPVGIGYNVLWCAWRNPWHGLLG